MNKFGPVLLFPYNWTKGIWGYFGVNIEFVFREACCLQENITKLNHVWHNYPCFVPRSQKNLALIKNMEIVIEKMKDAGISFKNQLVY